MVFFPPIIPKSMTKSMIDQWSEIYDKGGSNAALILLTNLLIASIIYLS